MRAVTVRASRYLAMLQTRAISRMSLYTSLFGLRRVTVAHVVPVWGTEHAIHHRPRQNVAFRRRRPGGDRHLLNSCGIAVIALIMRH